MYVMYSLACVDSHPSKEYEVIKLDDESRLVLPIIVLDPKDALDMRKQLHDSVDSFCDTVSISKFVREN